MAFDGDIIPPIDFEAFTIDSTRASTGGTIISKALFPNHIKGTAKIALGYKIPSMLIPATAFMIENAMLLALSIIDPKFFATCSEADGSNPSPFISFVIPIMEFAKLITTLVSILSASAPKAIKGIATITAGDNTPKILRAATDANTDKAMLEAAFRTESNFSTVLLTSTLILLKELAIPTMADARASTAGTIISNAAAPKAM